MSAKSIAIVILTWNGLELTRRCLTSLQLSMLPPNVHVIVVDNGSQDGTPAYIRSLPNITLIENGRNLGYAKAVNIGIRAAVSDADIVLLNNDVEPDRIRLAGPFGHYGQRRSAVGGCGCEDRTR